VGYIVLIVFVSLFIIGIIAYAIYAFWNRRKGFMGPESSNESSGLKATYY
jgi:phage shock protein PspC (stress-responsive transcriptional regulator)